MTAFRLIRTHLCPLFLAASMLALAACGAKIREPVAEPPPPPPVTEVAPPEEPPPALPQRPDKYFEGNVTKVGLLLPLSGRNQALGQAMLEAAQLALFDVKDTSIVLLPRDTETSKGAAGAAEDAILDGAQILLGPIFADAIRAAGPVARQYRVPLVGFSTDRTVAGSGVYILGFTPQQQVDRIVKYSIDHGWKRLAALVPESAYGTMVTEAMRNAASKYGGQIVTIETFAEKEEALAPPVERLAARKTQVPPAQPMPPPVPGAPPQAQPQPEYQYAYDAVLIATGGGLLKTLAPMLPYYDIDPAKVKFLGTGLWDDPSLRSEEALAGALYAGPSPETGAAFSSHYGKVYGGSAPRVASIAYDSVALVAALKRTHPDRPFAASALADPKGFAGIDGVFRFGPDGIAERGLAVIQITPAGMSAVDPAPQEFGAPVARPAPGNVIPAAAGSPR
jgi:ABC-type branched-subunit amino acid transport system substrate-binding protein